MTRTMSRNQHNMGRARWLIQRWWWFLLLMSIRPFGHCLGAGSAPSKASTYTQEKSVRLTNYEGVWENGCTDPSFLDPSTTWR